MRSAKAYYLATPLLIAVIGLAASAAAAFQVARTSAAKDRARFEHLVAQAQDSIAGRLDTHVAMLRAGAGFVDAAGGRIDAAAFRDFVGRLQLPTHYPGIQGIGYSVRTPIIETGVAPAALGQLGHPRLQVYPPGRRDEIHAIVYLEPLDRRNRAALGYDMFSEPVRRVAMERARDSGRPAVSGAVQLVQEIDRVKQAGFLIYVPVYRGGAVPPDVETRRSQLLGFVYSPFRADDLMRGIFSSAMPTRLDLEIYDGAPSPERLLHRSPGVRAAHPSFRTQRTLEIAGRTWTIVYSTRAAFESSSSGALAPLVFAAGSGATLLLAAAAWFEARARRRAETASAAARVTAYELQVLHETAGRLAAELDRDRLVQAITDAARELSGAEVGAFFYNVTHPSGDRYLLFTVSGAPREAFARLGMPRKTEIFSPTFHGEGVVRSDDITKDHRFGHNAPYRGFPPGHWPVRSYLAMPVVSRSGEVIGSLFFGHSRVGVFSRRAEQTVSALAGHAAIAIDNANLFRAAQEEIAARKAIEAQQQCLLGELNHRVKNTLATVQAIAAQTLRTSDDLSGFRQAFEARLIALSEAHNLLSQEAWQGVMLHDIVVRELAPHGIDDVGRFSVSGSPVWLSPSAAVALGMTLHELATNAARHGALAGATGHVAITWTTAVQSSGGFLRLEWRESGGEPVAPPTRRGFGTRMIERGLKHELGGDARMLFEPAGLRCVIEVPLPPAEDGAAPMEAASDGLEEGRARATG